MKNINKIKKIVAGRRAELLSKKNVVGVGAGHKMIRNTRTDEPAVVVFVEKKMPQESLMRGEAVPSSVDGVKTDVVEIGKVKLLDIQEASRGRFGRTSRHRPVVPGISIGHYQVSAGTLGAIVKDARTGEPLILSNNHILANSTNGRDGRSKEGDPVWQPAMYDGGTEKDQVATLLRFVPLVAEEEPAQCLLAKAAGKSGNNLIRLLHPQYQLKVVRRSNVENVVDAALARPVAEDLVDPEIMDIGMVKGVAGVEPGETVIKSGRTSGVTSGTVIAVGTTVRVDGAYGDQLLFTDQVVSDMFSQPGDSGSLVLNEEKMAVGLLFAGSHRYTIFNLIVNVIKKLDIEF